MSSSMVRSVRRWVRRSIRLAFTPSLFSHGTVQLLRPRAGNIPARIRGLMPVRGVFDVDGVMGVNYRMEFDGTDGSPEWIFWEGLSRYEVATQRLLRRLLPRTQCFLDVGANAGAYTFAAALQPHRPQVHAFEPEPYSLERLRRNVQINDFRNVAVHGVALADESGTSLLFLPSYGHNTSSLVERAGGAVGVAVTTLDEWAANEELRSRCHQDGYRRDRGSCAARPYPHRARPALYHLRGVAQPAGGRRIDVATRSAWLPRLSLDRHRSRIQR